MCGGVTPQLAKLLLIDTLINLFDKLIDWLVLPNKLKWVKKKKQSAGSTLCMLLVLNIKDIQQVLTNCQLYSCIFH